MTKRQKTQNGVLEDLLGLLAIILAALFCLGCAGGVPMTGAGGDELPTVEAGAAGEPRIGVVCSRTPLVVIYCEEGAVCKCPDGVRGWPTVRP